MEKLKAFVSHTLSSLVWKLPSSIHTAILAKTGWRLVQITGEEIKRITFKWTKKYPLEIEGVKESCTL